MKLSKKEFENLIKEEVKKAMEKRNQQNESLKNEQNVKIIKDKID